jgi:hypothetical protein
LLCAAASDEVGVVTDLNRRTFFEAFATAAALQAIMASGALASPPADLDRWAQDVADINRALSTGKFSLLAWQHQIEVLNTGVALSALSNYLDFDRLTAAMTFPSNLAETRSFRRRSTSPASNARGSCASSA